MHGNLSSGTTKVREKEGRLRNKGEPSKKKLNIDEIFVKNNHNHISNITKDFIDPSTSETMHHKTKCYVKVESKTIEECYLSKLPSLLT